MCVWQKLFLPTYFCQLILLFNLFLLLFMGPNVLLQLVFTFIYSIFNKNFQFQQNKRNSSRPLREICMNFNQLFRVNVIYLISLFYSIRSQDSNLNHKLFHLPISLPQPIFFLSILKIYQL